MIKKTKSKIFMIVMLSLSITILSIILIINIVNYKQTMQQSFMAINNANKIFQNETILPMGRPDLKNDKPKNFVDWSGTKFYFSVIDDNNNIQIINNNDEGYSDEKIEKYTLKVVNNKNNRGKIGTLIYDVKIINNNKIITFMDNSVTRKNLLNMFGLSIIIAIISLIFNYFISKKISLKIIEPIEETFNKQKQFISDASHELKTPLAVIGANADTIEGEIGSNKWLTYIQREVVSMDKLVNNLLSFARVENNNSKDDYIEFDISKTILGSTMVFESLAYEREIQLKENIEENLRFKGNNNEIKQLLSILLDNAIRHCYKGGEIIVNLRKQKNSLMLQVRNSGDPIKRGEEEKIFERFYRSDESRNRDEKRYGLGLSIAKAIVNKHGGKISAFSKNGYTTFTVIF